MTVRRNSSFQSSSNQFVTTLALICMIGWISGCSSQRKQAVQFSPDCGPCQTMLQQIDYPDLVEEQAMDGSDLLTGPPITISNFQESVPWELTVEECVELALANSKVIQKLGGFVVSSPQAVSTVFDQAITETGGTSVEAALSAFDAQVESSFFYNRSERQFNNPFFGGGATSLTTNASNARFGLSKQTATGASFAFRNLTDYNRSAVNSFGSSYDMIQQLEVRQPLGRGRGTMINRIAGPNATPGNYNGVLISRIRSDISLADFEAAVRDLVRDVENNYWELYFAYRDLDTKVTAREAARGIWANRKLRYDEGLERPDDEALARQQYFSFQLQAQNVLTGLPNGAPGVLGSERNLRRLMGMRASDGQIIRPISQPSLAPVVFDWEQTQTQALERRVELRRQKWTIRQRELEFMASKSLNKWRFDFVGQYGFRGFGDKLLSAADSPNGGAFNDSIKGDLDDWQVGLELNGAIGNRLGHLAIRNAELNLVRERAILKEQQRQILLDLNSAFTEVDRAMASLKSAFNSRVAVQAELNPKLKRVDGGQEPVFFLLDAEQRAASSESAVHRSVADYNKALVSYAYTSGSLLSRFNIHLTEGPWSDEAKSNAVENANRYGRRGPNDCDVDTCPVSYGPYDQYSRNMRQGNSNYAPQSVEPAPAELTPQQYESPPFQNENSIEGQFQPESEATKPSPSPSYDLHSKTGLDFSSPTLTAKQYLEELLR